MKVRDIDNLLDGWTGLRVMRFDDEKDEYEEIFCNHSMTAYLEDKVADYEITTISVEKGDIVLKCDYWEV